jgi:hypothetical protein
VKHVVSLCSICDAFLNVARKDTPKIVLYIPRLLWLIFLIPVLTYMNTGRKTAQETDIVYLVNKEIYCVFKTCCVTVVLFSQNSICFIIVYCICSNNTHVFHRLCTQI